MGQYRSNTPRITVKFINSSTEETISEVSDRNWMNVGELFSSHIASSIVINDLKNKKLPKKIMVLAVIEMDLVEDE